MGNVHAPFRIVIAVLFWLGAGSGGAPIAFAQNLDEQEGVIFAFEPGRYNATLHLNTLQNPLDFDKLAQTQGSWLALTGVYTAVEKSLVGLAVIKGKLVQPYSQPWDGVLIIHKDGTLALHRAGKIMLEGEAHSLKRGLKARSRLINKAIAMGITIVQSHMLVIDGKNDVFFQENQPRFIRRLLVQDQQGRMFIWQSKRSLTLYEAGLILSSQLGAQMAFNLDMGSYNFCRHKDNEQIADCGILEGVSKLSNLLFITHD